jgi:two-component system, NarL family, sensor histidine kinase FusK
VADAQNLALLAHNRDLTQQLLHTQEAERRALARELHDEVAQNCVAIRAEANFIAHSGDAAQANHDSANTNTHTTAAAASAHRITQAAENLHRIVRRLLTRLRPEVLDSLGLTAAIQDLCETWETQTGIACSFVPSLGQQGVDTAPPLSDDCTITLYRAVQEALSNAARHAQANHVHITLQWSPSQIELTIEDNGIGLPAPHHQPTQGFGLLGMRERVASLQGSLQLLPVASGGLRIEVRLPVNL